ncbi:MAG TPA: hypothetical protein VK524_33065 [Polyangiaceae bacterium]|nr:hypothetical protein [Polyangiaceae bacterium]
MIPTHRIKTFALLVGLASAGCTANVSTDGDGLGEEGSNYKANVGNGLMSINGLTGMNGLMSINGLNTMNGMISMNGLMSMNGLITMNGMISLNGFISINGMTSVNGLIALNGLTSLNGLISLNGLPVDPNATLPVDCGAAGVPGIDCWGIAGGILNPFTGLLRSETDSLTAGYMVRCALPAGESVNVVDYRGTVAHFPGELGLAPGWKSGNCDGNCQEDVSACLMALTNGEGKHIPLTLASTKNSLGGGHPSEYKYQEGAFYGNIFLSPPKGFFCIGTGSTNIATMWFAWDTSVNARMCSGYASRGLACPYKQTGQCTGMPWSPQKCSKTSDTMTSCKDDANKTWQRPITTFMKTKPGS